MIVLALLATPMLASATSSQHRSLPAPHGSNASDARISTAGLELDVAHRSERGVVERVLSVATTSFGRIGCTRAVGAGELHEREGGSGESTRFEVARAGLVEWYQRAGEGIEHGWTITAEPECEARDQALWIGVTFDGLAPRISEGWRHVALVDERGVQRLAYRDLRAWDASGRALDARFDASGGELGVRVDDAGATYPVFVDPLLGPADFNFEPNQNGARLEGCAPGDFDGDGYSDLIVGASHYNADEGRVWLFRGSSNGLSGAPTWETNGPGQPGSRCAWPCALGDIDGDGLDDFAISATHYTGTATEEGLIQVYRGSATGVPVLHWTILGGSAFHRISADVYAGDVNGDGRDDLVVTRHPVQGESLELYAGSGGASPGTPIWTLADTQLAALVSALPNSLRHLGSGDVDADGFDDLIVSALQDATSSGIVYLFRGGPGGPAGPTPTWSATLAGAPANAYFGRTADIVGDIDGNGHADVVVGVPGNPAPDRGSFHVFLADPNLHGASLFPSAPSQSFSEPAPEDFARFGSCRSAGDFDGDGFADVVVGTEVDDAPNNDGDDRVRIYRGTPTGLEPTATWLQPTPQASSQYGLGIGSSGDVNGDGRTDVWVTARLYDGGVQVDEGRAFVYHGRSAGQVVGTIHTGATAFTGTMSSGFGTAVAIGDVNGDGLEDVLVGSPSYSNGEFEEGRVALYLADEVMGFQTTPAWTFESHSVGARLGTAVAICRDVDRDGFDDVLVGAPYWTNFHNEEGRVWLFRGTASGDLGQTAAWTRESDGDDERFGMSLAGAGDCDGDGFADVIIGSPGRYLGQPDRGHARVFYGRPNAALHIEDSTPLDGAQAGARFGAAVAGADDINRDGFSDVLVGAPDWSSGQAQEGRAFAYLGGPNGVVTTANWGFEPNVSGARFGAALASAGDLSPTGLANVIIGAPGFASGPVQGGSAFLFLAQPGLGPNLGGTPVAALGETQSGAGQGSAVAFAGDVDSDGLSDVLVGAPGFDGAGGAVVDGGRVQLYLGVSTGLADPAAWTREGAIANGRLGSWCAGGGDFDGDGFSDLAFGVPGDSSVVFNPGSGGQSSYFGSDQRRLDDTAAVSLLGRTEDTTDFLVQGVSYNSRSIPSTVLGREDYRLEFETDPFGAQLDGQGLQRSPAYVDSGPVTSTPPPIRAVAAGLPASAASSAAIQWRVRIEHRNPLVPHTRWLYVQGNGTHGKKLGTAPDCNGNGIADQLELSGSTDCNGDAILDVCQVPPLCPTCVDCNGNQVPDACELDFGNDCDGNQVPDDCQPDCDGMNGADACEILQNPGLDTNNDGVLDSCQTAVTIFCPGDGSGTACPCANHSLPGDAEGCLHSLGTGGRLRSVGVPRVSADNLVLVGTRMPNSSALYFQGIIQQNGGAGATFGDGKRCAGGSTIRLGTKINSTGASQYPQAGDTAISVRGAIPLGGGTRTYQVWYRNAAAFCTASTFNLTNGLNVVWVP